MSPHQPDRVVPIGLAEMAVEVQAIKGELALVTSRVGQSIDTLTTLVHEVQAEQLRAREDRIEQIGLLHALSEKAGQAAGSGSRVHELELKVSRWIGVIVGFGAAVFMVFALIVYAYQGDKAMILKNVDTNSASIRELQAHRP